jgi:hypothetical protein
MMAEPEIGVSGRGKTSNTLYMRSEEQSESILEAARKRGGGGPLGAAAPRGRRVIPCCAPRRSLSLGPPFGRSSPRRRSQGGCDQWRSIRALIATGMWQRIEKCLRLKSVRRVGPAPDSPLPGEHMDVRTARPTKKG